MTLKKDNVFSAILEKTGAQRPVTRGAVELKPCGPAGQRGLTSRSCLHPAQCTASVWWAVLCQFITAGSLVLSNPLPCMSQGIQLARSGTCVRFERQKRGSGHCFLKVFSRSCVGTDEQSLSLLCIQSFQTKPCCPIAAPSPLPEAGLQPHRMHRGKSFP